jgi:hypothetical protein
VQYTVVATDILKNNMTASGNYTVKQQPIIDVIPMKDPVVLGENLTVLGTIIIVYQRLGGSSAIQPKQFYKNHRMHSWRQRDLYSIL